MHNPLLLQPLGWQPFFQQQINLEELDQAEIARVVAHNRSDYLLSNGDETFSLPITPAVAEMTVGDWLLLEPGRQFGRLLERKSLFKRKAAGSKIDEQLIAANVDTLLIVCSLNDDFNLNRIERYLALAHEAQVTPVVVLTKADLCPDSDAKQQAVQSLDPLLMVVAVNATDADSCAPLLAWCGVGQTLSLLGSSGVGKSTLANTLLGQALQQTAAIREDDSKGRHTTTARSLLCLPSGAVLIDTPGMRELQLAACEEGVRQVFADIETWAEGCKFSDCHHTGEPGCAVANAVAAGELSPRRLHNYQKLLAEQARNSASLQELRAKEKRFGRLVKSVGSESRKNKKGY
ncbi:ribosome small subunit-dependent GTPase A [Halioxenophilus sp. WMMB6]|uniref:ribosome small subunit-dependent GTPase A n=1 Tax=Halioxenophilus sp. WMMB6 TaxID=3073815 RepID=UPI00295EFBA2|nr:ribosome small subunit-dependent GTPase A [Halioxenophilus sp. WMMB6]